MDLFIWLIFFCFFLISLVEFCLVDVFLLLGWVGVVVFFIEVSCFKVVLGCISIRYVLLFKV